MCLNLILAICLFVVKLVLNIIPIYHREISLYTPCPWQVILIIVVDFVDHLHIGSCVVLPHLLPSVYLDFHCLPCHSHGSSPFQLVLFSVVNDIWSVMIPRVCILYSNANIKIMHESWGRFPLLFRTLFYQSIFYPFNWHLISILCGYGRQTFSFYALCHHKSVESVWFICCNRALSRELLSHS